MPTILDSCPITENVVVELFGPDGELKERREIHNAVPTVGKEAYAAQVLTTPGKEKPTHMAIGKKSTATAEGDTTLAEELNRVALTSKTRSGNVVTMVGTWAPGSPAGTNEVKEAGILNASSSGDLYNRATFGVITKESGDELVITWKVTFG